MPVDLHLTCARCGEWCDDDHVEIAPLVVACRVCPPEPPDAPLGRLTHYVSGRGRTWAARAEQSIGDAQVAAYRAGYKAGFRAAGERSDSE